MHRNHALHLACLRRQLECSNFGPVVPEQESANVTSFHTLYVTKDGIKRLIVGLEYIESMADDCGYVLVLRRITIHLFQYVYLVL